MEAIIPFISVGLLILVISVIKYRDHKSNKAANSKRNDKKIALTKEEDESEKAREKAEKAKSLGRGGGPL